MTSRQTPPPVGPRRRPQAPPPARPAEPARDRRRLAGGGAVELVGFPRSFTDERWVIDRPIDVIRYEKVSATPFLPVTTVDGAASVAGALYDARGRLIVESERAVARGRLSSNPPTLADPPRAPVLPGEYVYVGFAIQSYGHFLVEILSRLWWVAHLDDLKGVNLLLHGWKGREGRARESRPPTFLASLLTRFGINRPPSGATNFLSASWVKGFFEILGIEPGQVSFVSPIGAQIEAVRVPAPALVVNGHAHPEFPRLYRLIADKVAGDVGPGSARLYLSRSKLTSRRGGGPAKRPADNEKALEALLARHGFSIVHPQEMPLAEQIRLMRSAAVVAGCDGSALHNVVFARPGTRVLAFDSRVVENQFAIEEACGLEARHLWMGGGMPYSKPNGAWSIDLDRVERNLDFARGG